MTAEPTRGADYDDLYRKALATANSAFESKDPDELADRILTKTVLTREHLAHVMTRGLLDLVAPGRVGDLGELRDELVEAMDDITHDHADDEECDGGTCGQYVDDVVMPIIQRYAAPVMLPALWRFDVPEVPARVTALNDGDGDLYVRHVDNPDRWSRWLTSLGGPSNVTVSTKGLLFSLPLIECPDPREGS